MPTTTSEDDTKAATTPPPNEFELRAAARVAILERIAAIASCPSVCAQLSDLGHLAAALRAINETSPR